jgi:hypothetical protein
MASAAKTIEPEDKRTNEIMRTEREKHLFCEIVIPITSQ